MRKDHPSIKESLRYDLPCLSPKHEKVENSRKIMKINEAIKSIMSMGNMEKMELIAINNKCLFNYGKVKRAEWTNRKSTAENPHFFPNLKGLRIDAKGQRQGNKSEIQSKMFKSQKEEPEGVMPESEAALCEKYIEDYLNKLREEKRYDILANREQLIEQACREIQLKMQQQHSKLEQKQLIRHIKTEQQQQERISKEFKGNTISRKIRSITEVQYAEELNRINKSSEYSSKRRILNEKMFLRRIKKLQN